MARAIGHDTLRRVAPQTRAVRVAGEVGSLPLGRAEDEDGALGEQLNGGNI